jgi:chaperonin GroEL
MKKIVSGDEARAKLLAGLNLIADAVKRTLGPDGNNCVYIRTGTSIPFSTRDGVTVAREIEAEDPLENIGVNLIKGVANEAVDSSGDGTTTATLLAQAIFAEGVRAIIVGANPVALKRGIERATRAVVEALKGMARQVEGEMIKQVATISANNDPFLGGLIAAAMEKSGDDGVVTVEVSRSPESSLVIVDGMQINAGYISPDFVTDRERNECVLEDCYILLHEGKLSTLGIQGESLTKMAKTLQDLAAEKKSFLVIAEDVTDEALNVLAIASRNSDPRFLTLRSCAMKTPGSVEHLLDLAALTGAKVVTELTGVKLRDLDRSYFGRAKRVVVKSQQATIIAHEGQNDRLTQRLQELRTQVKEATDEGQRIRLQSRLARLSGGVAIIRVGAATEVEMVVRKEAIEDAVHATRGAMLEGVVPGGGIALARACPDIFNTVTNEDELVGISILRKACLSPLRTLAENGGESPEFVLKTALRSDHNCGWNARTGEYGDMYAMGIIDPVRVVRVAIESAASVAALMIITHCLVAENSK